MVNNLHSDQEDHAPLSARLAWAGSLLLFAVGGFVVFLCGLIAVLVFIDHHSDITDLKRPLTGVAFGLIVLGVGWFLRKVARPAEEKILRDIKEPVPSISNIDVLIPDSARNVRMTEILIALNVSVFIGMCVAGASFFNPTTEQVLAWGADYGPMSLHGQWWRIFASLFVHFGFLHLAFNMLALYYVGRWAESIFGSLRFGAMYLVAGLGGNAMSLLCHPNVISAGASGAIFGIMGMLAGFLGFEEWRSHLPEFKDSFKGIAVFLLYSLRTNGRGGVDLAAHFGGLLSGALLGLLFGAFVGAPEWMAPRVKTARPKHFLAYRWSLIAGIVLMLVATPALIHGVQGYLMAKNPLNVVVMIGIGAILFFLLVGLTLT